MNLPPNDPYQGSGKLNQHELRYAEAQRTAVLDARMAGSLQAIEETSKEKEKKKNWKKPEVRNARFKAFMLLEPVSMCILTLALLTHFV